MSTFSLISAAEASSPGVHNKMNQPSTSGAGDYNHMSNGHHEEGSTTSQQFLGAAEAAAGRLKRAFGRKRSTRPFDEDDGIVSDSQASQRPSTASSSRRVPKIALQFASTTLHALAQRRQSKSPNPSTEKNTPGPSSYQAERMENERPPRISFDVDSKPLPSTSHWLPESFPSAALDYSKDSQILTEKALPAIVTNQLPQSFSSDPLPSARTTRSNSIGNEASANITPISVKRRSMSLSLAIDIPNQTLAPAMSSSVPPSAFTTSPVYSAPSYPPPNQSQALPATYPPLPSSTVPSAFPNSKANMLVVNGSTSSLSTAKSSGNLRGKLAAWTSSQPKNPPQSTQQSHSKASSVVASFAPVASAASAATGKAFTFSKKAYERVNNIWSANSSQPNDAHQSPTEPSDPPTSWMKSRSSPRSTSGNWGGSSGDESKRKNNPPNPEFNTGPDLGTLLRPPILRGASAGGGGLVFGRPLADCVRDTGPALGPGDTGSRHIPALVLRCVQHLEKWGVVEEGLFRLVHYLVFTFFCV